MPTVYGTPTSDGDNVVVVCHALTGNSRVEEWWPGLVGPGALFDPAHWCVIGVDIPLHARNMHEAVSAQRQAVDELGITQIRFVIGGSLGGMQALQWALDAPSQVGHAIVVGAHDHHSAMGIALNAVQRDAIALDSVRGLGLARKIAMLTYKSEELLTERHGRRPDRHRLLRFDIEGYLDHHAEKLVARMSPQTYVERTRLMDSFDVRHRAHEVRAEVTFVGISSDWLFRAYDVMLAAQRFGARYIEFESDHGHDAFLAEATALADLLSLTVAHMQSLVSL